ncbi:MAG TPA: efflux RND transporter permease subunit [Gammaproteobacteria bacterium]|nr:efflux RND transporter permease subunit [Gammaproteobacteria bacterium]
MGISGRIARLFLQSEITPLLALAGLLLGLFAVLVTPREEEPQINVTFANVFIPYPGASASEVEHLVTTPAEQVLAELEGIKHIYSVSLPGQSILTVRFRVGEDRTQAIVRLYNALYSNRDWLHPGVNVGQPIIKPKGIDDVPIVSLTLWTDDGTRGSHELQRVAHAIEAELKRVQGTRDIYTIGGPDRIVAVRFDPAALAGYGLDLQAIRSALAATNFSRRVGSLVYDNQEVLIQAGEFLTRVEEIRRLVIAVHDGRPVYLEDVAEVSLGADQPHSYTWLGTGPAGVGKGIEGTDEYPAVTVAIAKQPGTNAVDIADQVIARVETLRGVFIPDGVNVTITRNYGATADAKARKLISKLIFATASVVLLVLLALGWRESIIVGFAVVVTLAITLFASWAWGFTLNRVSLFALIFSIGILVDDAIVVVENIHRHLAMGKRRLVEAIPLAVDEVGGPTILATLTVIAALLPMAFVTGLMGPYMSPIPINASIGMIISLLVAFVVTPWLSNRMLGHAAHATAGHDGSEDINPRLYRVFQRLVGPFIDPRQGRKRRWWLVGGIVVLMVLSVSLVLTKSVVLKMLPFDNKSEFQVIVDMPEGTPVEHTARVLTELAAVIRKVPEVSDYQVYAGTAAPINFNGLVRQYYLRQQGHLGDIQVNLVDKKARDRQSHEIAASLRASLTEVGRRHGAIVKVVEVPPGPPVQSPLVAEIYGLDYAGQQAVARQVMAHFRGVPEVVDVDDSSVASTPRMVLAVDRDRAAQHGVAQQTVVATLAAAMDGEDVSYLHDDHAKYPIPVRLQLAPERLGRMESLLDIRLRNREGRLVNLGELVTLRQLEREQAIYHKDLLPVVYVTGDVAGETDSPLYGMFGIYASIARGLDEAGRVLPQYLIDQPAHPYHFSLKWDGEWQITYETFRDMGIAYSVGLILIYLLVVGQFRSYITPLVIMAPIPLTIIGVMPGHALLDKQFTATSMIGMIALAGIIVRNSILLVDFINQERARGLSFEEAVLRSGAVRTKPIVLTGLAAMLGAFFILDDPIFSGLAVALIFGILVSTLLTLVVIPVMYYAFNYRRQAGPAGGGAEPAA